MGFVRKLWMPLGRCNRRVVSFGCLLDA
ncbi:hypothetical protein OIU79_023973, partial [Salix purpurea]